MGIVVRLSSARGRGWARVISAGAFLSTLALASLARADITVRINEPAHPRLVADSVDVQVQVDSTYQLQTVRAVVETAASNLSYGGGVTGWTGVLSLNALASGSKTLVVTATDVMGDTGSSQVSIQLDRPPVVRLLTPEPRTVARGPTRFSATCSDDNAAGCRGFGIHQDTCTGKLLASGTATSIDAVVSLDAHEGRPLGVAACASDSSNQLTQDWTPGIYVESSPWLVERETVGGWGEVLNFSASHLIWRDRGGLWLRDRATDQDTLLVATDGTGFVTARGAIWQNRAGPYTWEVRELQDGQVILHAAAQERTPVLQVAGKYAAWMAATPASDTIVVRRDLATGQNRTLGNGYLAEGALIADGQLAFFNDYNVSLFNGTTTQQLTSEVAATTAHGAVYDGVNIVYVRRNPATSTSTLLRHDKSTESAIASGYTDAPEPGLSYQVRDGWVAFLKVAGGAEQAFVRSPQAVEQQTTAFGTSSHICAMGNAGALLVNNRNPNPWGKRYLATPGSAPRFVSSGLGKCVFRDGAWYVMLGRSLFEVTGSGPVDAGTGGDAAQDAGSEASVDGSSEIDAGTGGSMGSSAGGTGGSDADGSAGTGVGGDSGNAGSGGSGAEPGAGGASVAGNGGTGAAGTSGSPSDGGMPVAGSAGRGKSQGSGQPQDDDSGCSVQPGPSSAFSALLLLSGFALARRRRAA